MKFKINQRVILTRLNNIPATIVKFAGGGCCGCPRRWWVKYDNGQRVMVLEEHIVECK